MTDLSLIGIGPGHPRFLTRAAEAEMRRCDVILIPCKGPGKDDLADLRRRICAEVAPAVTLREFDLPRRGADGPYLDRVDTWHDAIAARWQREITASGAQRVGLLIWGDPALYDSSLRIAGRLSEVTLRVIPGITAIQAMTAAHAVPLNALGAPVTITTGRRLRAEGWPDGASSVVVMLDQGGAFATLDPEGIEIWWAAYAGMTEEIRLSGALSAVSDQIIATRKAARDAHGWIMDIYLMRKA